MSKSVSVTKGKGSMRHNNRTFSADNVDKTRSHLNTYYVQEPLKTAYEKCFGAAVEEYDKKQKRADRKIGGVSGYMKKIRNSGNREKLFYETIFQIGNKYDSNARSQDGKICAQILDEYMKQFKERNPNLYVFNAVLHVDEETPHLHVDYIPLATEYKQGMQIRNSLDKALKQQGIGGKANKFESSTIAWENKEKDFIATLMSERGLEKTADTGLKRDHKSLEHYKDTVAEIENRMKAAELNFEIHERPNKLNKDEVILPKVDLERLTEMAKLSVVHRDAVTKLQQEAEKIVAETSAENQQVRRYKLVVSEQADKLKEGIKQAREVKDRYSASTIRLMYNNAVNRVDTLEAQNNDLKAKNSALEAKVKEQESEIEIRVTKAVEAVVKPLQAKIEKQEQTIGNLAFFMNALLQLVRYVRDRFAGRLTNAFLSAAIKKGEEQLAREEIEVSSSARVSSLYRKEIVLDDLSYRRGDEGKGLYTGQGTFVYAADTIKEAREAFPMCKIKNELEKGFER